jgi:hypothetical protein
VIDLLTGAAQYRAHLSPIFEALPEEIRGHDHRIHGPLKNGMPRGEAVLVGSGRDLSIARGLGYKRIAYAEHGIGQSYGNRNPSYPGGVKRDAVGLFLSPNATAAKADSNAYPDAWVAQIGDPRLDTLPAANSSLDVIAFSFHWNCFVAKETLSTLRYWGPYIATLKQRYRLVGHGHPRAPEVERFCHKQGIPFIKDFDDVVRQASLYICDNSSTIYEFASTGRPVLLLNAPWYRREVEFGLRFWEAAGVGLHVDSPEELAEKVQSALDDPPAVRHERERALDMAYAVRTGAADRAALALASWL